MKADREPNRLPLRAGAMLLLAVAVVFIGLGWHSAATNGQESAEDKLANAGKSVQTITAQPTSEKSPSAKPTSAAPSKSASPSSSVRAGDSLKLCVLNAGTTGGLAKKVSDELAAKGFAIGTDPANLSTSSVTENTVFYDEGDDEAAQKVADEITGATIEARPSAFTKCPGELAVVVVTP